MIALCFEGTIIDCSKGIYYVNVGGETFACKSLKFLRLGQTYNFMGQLVKKVGTGKNGNTFNYLGIVISIATEK